MRIAVCDDEIAQTIVYDHYLERLKNIFPKCEYECFYSGESILSYFENEHKPFDVIFLDVEMNGMNGLQTAERIRRLDENVILIYATSHREYVYDAFEANPLRFLVKPVTFERFSEVLTIANEKIMSNKKSIFVVSDRKQMRFCSDEIVFIESDRRKLLLHTSDGQEYEIYGKLDEWAQKLYVNDFILVHKSYLVNMSYITAFDAGNVTLTNRRVIPISESRRKYAKEEHYKYIMRCYRHDQ